MMMTKGTLTDLRNTPGRLYAVVALTGDVSDWYRLSKVEFIEDLREQGYTRAEWRKVDGDILFLRAIASDR